MYQAIYGRDPPDGRLAPSKGPSLSQTEAYLASRDESVKERTSSFFQTTLHSSHYPPPRELAPIWAGLLFPPHEYAEKDRPSAFGASAEIAGSKAACFGMLSVAPWPEP